MDYSTLSTEELLSLKGQYQKDVDIYGTSQLARKVLLNSLYGALANEYFRFYRTKDAEAITISGQQAIKYLGKSISKYIGQVVGDSNDDTDRFYYYGDTDSVVGSSVIEINGVKTTIEEFFDSIESPVIYTQNNAEVKMVEGVITPTITDDLKLVERDVNYVMRHLTEKRLYDVMVSDKIITVTADHSLIVLRDFKLVEATVTDILDTDKFIYIDDGTVYVTDDWYVRSCGLTKEYVYDIEVEDTHRFIANDVLVHNSVYMSIQDMVDKYSHRVPEDKMVDFLDNFIEKKVQPHINKTLDDLCSYMNTYQMAMGAKRESIFSAAIWASKKRYALHVWDLEGTRYAKPKVKVTGIETQKSSTPEPVREALLKCLEILLSSTEVGMREYVEQFRNEFQNIPVEEIAFPRGVNGIEKYTTASGEPAKGCPIHVRAAIVYNTYVAKKYPDTYQAIASGDKLKYIHLKQPNPYGSAVIGFPEKLPKNMGIEKYIDWDTQFEKSFLSPLTNLMETVRWKLEEESTLEEFFG